MITWLFSSVIFVTSSEEIFLGFPAVSVTKKFLGASIFLNTLNIVTVTDE